MKIALRICFVLACVLPFVSHADDTAIVGSNSFTGTNGIAMPITDVQLTGTATGTIPVKLLVTNGTLQMPVTAGLTFNGATSTTALYFSGTIANINNALASLVYTRSGTGTDTLEVSLVNRGEVFFEGSGHLYQYISYTGTWGQAKTDAETKTLYGATGYLTTITSQAENDFVAARLTNAGWMGASDSASEGDWKWVTGPETGTSFWSGNINGSTVGGRYANWGSGEPNDSGSNEDCAQFLTGGTGKWNDLPCTVTTLPGYVVEFGSTGNMPTVVAKNVTITTNDAPSVSSVTPADNATNVATSTNLTIVFTQSVSTSTGNIIIRKGSDNTVFETIDVAGPKVSGSGTTYVINPATDFEENGTYYIAIPNTAFKNASNSFYAGMSASSTWNFTVGDFTAPVLSAFSETKGSTTASVTWTTNEAASTRLVYGLSNAFGATTTLADVSPRVTSHTVSLSALLPCSTYSYRALSADATGNTGTSTVNSFTTTGCIAAATTTAATSTFVNSATTSTTTLSSASSSITVATPQNFATTSSVVIQIKAMPGEAILETLGKPASGLSKVGPVVFDVKAIVNETTILDSFAAPVTITYTYTDEDISGLNESTLWLYNYHGSEWLPLQSCSVNMGTNTISCTTNGFSIFSLYGQPAASVSRVGPMNSASTVYGCKDKAAQNYNEFSSHVASLCEYGNLKPTAASATVVRAVTWSFTKDLSLNMQHADVQALQRYLNAKGFTVALSGPGSRGNETTRFGTATKTALIKYQKAMSIKPASGYFGPLTRASMK